MKRTGKEAKEQVELLKALRVVIKFANKWNLTTVAELKFVLFNCEMVKWQNFQRLLKKMKEMRNKRG